MGKRETGSLPEPTLEGSTRDSYWWPHSKTPEKDALYAFLRDLGWRYHQRTAAFHTPERDTYQAFGRLSYNPEITEAWITPPTPPDAPQHMGLPINPRPIIHFARKGMEWYIDEGLLRGDSQ